MEYYLALKKSEVDYICRCSHGVVKSVGSRSQNKFCVILFVFKKKVTTFQTVSSGCSGERIGVGRR